MVYSYLPLGASQAPPQPTSDLRRGSSTSAESYGLRRLDARKAMEEHHYLANRARARNYNPPIDLRLLDYVSAYDNNLMCPICRCPFVDPVILDACDHCFCRDCIRRTWNTGQEYTPAGIRGNCPSCRTPAKLGPRSSASKILINMTDELLVRCPKADEGCKSEIKRGEVQDHVNIYCPYALEECAAKNCDLPVLRQDASRECLHYSVSCLSCRKELQKWRLEAHWKNECPDRKVECELCNKSVYYRDLEEHNRRDCTANNIPCPGEPFGCGHRSKIAQAEVHASTCLLAKIAPSLVKQQERIEEQEAAQRQLVRKLEVLEHGFTAIQNILYPTQRERDSPLAETVVGARTGAPASIHDQDFALSSSSIGNPQDLERPRQISATGSPPTSLAPEAPGPRPSDLPEPYSADFELEPPPSLPPLDTQSGPYASPLHHLLSMHESLRDEISRMTTALSELEGRHSMQILNENLRAREEISYLGAQVGGLQRQVHWLTSTQLQRQQVGRSANSEAASSGSAAIADAAAGAGVEAAVSAVSTAANALRGAARMVSVGGREGSGIRRRPSEEGRTKL